MRELTEREIEAVSGGIGVAAAGIAWPDGLQPAIDWTSVPRIGTPNMGPLISPTVPVVSTGMDLAPDISGLALPDDAVYGGS